MNRRGFLSSILALGAAPAIVRAESLMKVSGIIVPLDPFEGFEWTNRPGYPLLTPTLITRESLKILKQNLILTRMPTRLRIA